VGNVYGFEKEEMRCCYAIREPRCYDAPVWIE